MRESNHTNYWTEEEREKLIKLAEQGLDHDVISARLGRSKGSIRLQLKRAKLGKPLKNFDGPKKPLKAKRSGKVTLPPLPSICSTT